MAITGAVSSAVTLLYVLYESLAHTTAHQTDGNLIMRPEGVLVQAA